ncbi:alanine racemase [Rheinheimera baltica]|uniref:alanine racemase n=1 Tax=Rheinheimera baltica TaxID=67576 RepID=UPI00273F319E|nr:alanine racemase [Rheinheimera baltica]MDP5192056.1 alanine racemase [Rheinheimera baltica]
MHSRRPQAIIDLNALSHNYQQVKQLAPNSKVLAVLKANAYGHGMLAVAQALKHADALGVARIDEALALRAGGITKPIVLLEGFFHADELQQVVASNLQLVIHHREQAEALLAAVLDAPVRVWLKVDSGMHRLGIYPHEFAELYQRLQQSPNVQGPMRLMTHFASSDELQNPATLKQLQLFQQTLQGAPGELSLANSAAVLNWPQSHGDWVRPGLMLYGVSPMAAQCSADHQLQPVMTLCSSVIAVREVSAGDAVGYGGSWIAAHNTRLAVVAIGYGDGYPRGAGNNADVLINGKCHPIVGRVSMDMITVDIGTAPVAVGDKVVLWGADLPVEELARRVDTIPYELLCNITSRVQFSYIRHT